MDLKKLMTTAPPPPPSQVKIRTMRSDIESMMRSGGGSPTFQDVAVSGLTLEKEYKPPTEFHAPAPMATAAPVAAPVEEAPSAPAVVTPTVSAASIAPTAPDMPVENVPPPSGKHSNFMPLLIVTIVAILAIASVGYFAYTLFIK